MDNMTVSEFLKGKLEDDNELYLNDKRKYLKLQEERELVRKGQSEFINNNNKTSRVFKQKGMSNLFNDYTNHYKEMLDVAKNYKIFKEVLDTFLEQDRELLYRLKKEELLKKIDTLFESELDYKLGINRGRI